MMYCPSCGEQNEVGSHRCERCGHPFTRMAAWNTRDKPTVRRTHQATSAPVPVQQSSQPPRYPTQQQKRRGPTTCLVAFIALVVFLIGLVIAGLVVSNTVVQPFIADQVREELDAGLQSVIQDEITQQIGELPTGTITISEAEINANLDQHGPFGPIDDIDVDLTEEGFTADLRAYGFRGSYQSQARVENGEVRMEGSSVDGPLGFVIPTEELEQIANEAIATALNESGYQVVAISFDADAITLTVEDDTGGFTTYLTPIPVFSSLGSPRLL